MIKHNLYQYKKRYNLEMSEMLKILKNKNFAAKRTTKVEQVYKQKSFEEINKSMLS
jgi:hypothetical protein